MPNPKPRQPRRWTTDSQREAARRNGAKSKGPTTPAGKSRSSRNNLHYGLHTETLDLSTDPEYAARFRDHLNELLLPDHSNVAEIEALVSASLRRRRINALEEQLFTSTYNKSNIHSIDDIVDELTRLQRAESRQTNRYNRILRNMQNQFRGSNPTTTQTLPHQYIAANYLALHPELFHILSGITKSND